VISVGGVCAFAVAAAALVASDLSLGACPRYLVSVVVGRDDADARLDQLSDDAGLETTWGLFWLVE
jgi:hypothetical protein